MEFSTMHRCVALLVSWALLPLLGMAADSIGSYCAGSSYAGSNKAVASINAVLADLVATVSTWGGYATSTAGVTSQVLEKLKFRKLRVQKPEPPVLLCSGGQSTNRGAPHIATAAGYLRATHRPSSFHARPYPLMRCRVLLFILFFLELKLS